MLSWATLASLLLHTVVGMGYKGIGINIIFQLRFDRKSKPLIIAGINQVEFLLRFPFLTQLSSAQLDSAWLSVVQFSWTHFLYEITAYARL